MRGKCGVPLTSVHQPLSHCLRNIKGDPLGHSFGQDVLAPNVALFGFGVIFLEDLWGKMKMWPSCINSFIFTRTCTHRIEAVCLSQTLQDAFGPNVYSSWKKWLPVLIAPFCKLMPVSYPLANGNLAVLHMSHFNFDLSFTHSVRKFRKSISEGIKALTLNVKLQKTERKIQLCVSDIYISTSVSLNKAVYLQWEMCLCAGYEPHSGAVDNQVSEQCQPSNLASCGNEGPRDCQRQPSASQLQPEKCGGEWAAPFTPPVGDPASISS